MNVGSKIKELRQNKGWTQEKLAIESGISRVSIGNYERGDRVPPTDVSIKIAKAFDVSLNEIFGWTNEEVLAREVKLLEQIQLNFGKDVPKLLENYLLLNEKGKKKALEYLIDLSDNDKYTRT